MIEWNRTVFMLAYKYRIDGEQLGYCRKGLKALGTVYTERWRRLSTDLPVRKNDDIIVVGCGLGLLCETAIDMGYVNCVGMDSSPYIHDLWGEEAGQVILIEQDVREATTERAYDWVITEDVLTGYNPDEVDPVLDGCERIAKVPSQVVHMVTEPPISLAFTALPLDDWKALRPAHTWVSLRMSDWKVL